jgi:hypothetical protein
MSFKVKFFGVLVVIILGIAVLGYLKAIPGAENQENLPVIEITPKDFDFGEIQYGDTVNYTFQVKNTGQAVLEIKRVATSCSCTTAKIDKEELKPGETTGLLVTYDSGAMSGSHAKGPQERIIYVKSSDPINPQVQVMIYANVKPR